MVSKTIKATAVAAFTATTTLALAACDKPPVETTQTNNRSIEVEVLFTRHGCEVSRFSDGGRNRYLTICPK